MAASNVLTHRRVVPYNYTLKPALWGAKVNIAFELPANRASIKAAILEIWAGAFNLDQVDADADFFDLGGDSLIAEDIATSVANKFGLELRPSELLVASTPLKMAELIQARRIAPELPSHIAKINAGASGRPLFLIHGRAGITFPRKPFLDALGHDRPIFAFQAPGFDGKAEPLDRFDDFAAAYLDSMLQVQPEGPWSLVSFCAGGWIIFEILRLMDKRGLKPDKIILIDLPTSERMKLHDMVYGNVLCRSRIPLLSSAALAMGKALINLRFRYKFFKQAGAFVDGCDPEVARKDRRIQSYSIKRATGTHERKRAQVGANQEFSDGSMSGVHTEAHSKLLADVMGSDMAVLTSAKLRLAYFGYTPKEPCKHPVIIIYSNARAGNLKRPNSTLNRFFPYKTTLLVGDSHKEAIRSTKTASLISKIIRGEEAIPAPRPATPQSEVKYSKAGNG
jgi:acyl carrier protein